MVGRRSVRVFLATVRRRRHRYASGVGALGELYTLRVAPLSREEAAAARARELEAARSQL